MKQTLILLVALLCIASFGHSQDLYKKEGKASYYSVGFEGRRTANGEIFSSQLLTAAHPTLAFGTFVRVTNLRNNKSIIVRINDRGPYAKGRILDLAKAAADSLGFIRDGWTNVLIEEIPVMPTPEPTTFPETWAGNWKGDLNIYTSEGLKQTIPMELKIHSTPDPMRFTWSIVYNNEPRDYVLVVKDRVLGIFNMDEKNGIEITGYQLGNQYICRFEVEGNLLECVYEMKKEEELTFAIRSGEVIPEQYTEFIPVTIDTTSEVLSYPVNVLQQAVLLRSIE